VRSEQVRLELPIRYVSGAEFVSPASSCQGWARKSSISLRSFASLMRVKSLVPSFLIVAALFEPMH